MDDQVSMQRAVVCGGIRPPEDGSQPAAAASSSPPLSFPVEELSKLLSPLGLSSEQTKGVLNCLTEAGSRWIMPHMEATIERNTEFMAQVVKSCFHEVAAGAIHSFGSYAVLCVQRLIMHNEELKKQHQNELAQLKEYAAHLMLNLNHQKLRMEAEKKKLAEDLEIFKRRCVCGSQTHRNTKGSTKRKGDQMEELEQRQAAKKSGPTRPFRQKLSSVISKLPEMAPQTLIQDLANCAQQSMKLPALEVPLPDIDMNEITDHPLLISSTENKLLEKAAGDVCAGQLDEKEDEFGASLRSAPSENGGSGKPKVSGGTSGERSVLTTSHLIEDSQSGANDTIDGSCEPGRVSEKVSIEEEPTEELGKSASDGQGSSISTSKLGSEEGDNLQSVLVDVVDGADTTAALSLCQLGKSMIPSEGVMHSLSECHGIEGRDGLFVKLNGSKVLQGTSCETEAMNKRRKSAVSRSKTDLRDTNAADVQAQKTVARRKPRQTVVDKQKAPRQGSPAAAASDLEGYISRDQRRVSIVAKQLMAISERKYG
ncbi:hypothetical protein R1flu_014220 [Riccia fluitans]|uniref:Uncharacterized protein n=1 Tax=Riccia fluitans TaxID=41844 RepID=A0ABD1YGK5_9MARC